MARFNKPCGCGSCEDMVKIVEVNVRKMLEMDREEEGTCLIWNLIAMEMQIRAVAAMMIKGEKKHSGAIEAFMAVKQILDYSRAYANDYNFQIAEMSERIWKEAESDPASGTH